MRHSDEFFFGKRYAIFGVKARGRTHGAVLIDALVKAGKSAVAIEPSCEPIKGVDVSASLSEAGPVDGVVLLPPSPWDDLAAEFTTDAVRQCNEHGISNIWVYAAGDSSGAIEVCKAAGIDPYGSRCPCLNIVGSGFPHGFHRSVAKFFGTL